MSIPPEGKLEKSRMESLLDACDDDTSISTPTSDRTTELADDDWDEAFSGDDGVNTTSNTSDYSDASDDQDESEDLAVIGDDEDDENYHDEELDEGKRTRKERSVVTDLPIGVTYVVQRGFTVDGKTYHIGDVIPVKCKYCALWNKYYNGKIRCNPEVVLSDGTVMHEDKFSCESFFVCKELEPELNALLQMNVVEAMAVRRMVTGFKKVLAVENWLSNLIEKKKLDLDKIAVMKTAKGFIASFSSSEQLELIDPFVRQFITISNRRIRKKNTKVKIVKMSKGDIVEWVDLKKKATVRGVVLTIHRGLINIGGYSNGALDGKMYEFNMKEWKATRSPCIIRKAAVISE